MPTGLPLLNDPVEPVARRQASRAQRVLETRSAGTTTGWALFARIARIALFARIARIALFARIARITLFARFTLGTCLSNGSVLAIFSAASDGN
jgi:hypothetical protein